MRSSASFLFLGEALVVELAHAVARCRKGCGRFLKARDKELLCGLGDHACQWRDLLDTAQKLDCARQQVL
jgi:hypothetical protein